MKLFAALLLALPLTASAQYAPMAPGAGPAYGYGYGVHRSPWYIGFGLGSGDGSYTLGGATATFRDWNFDPPRSSATGFFNFKVGATLSPRLLLGFDLTGLRSQSDDAGFSTAIQVVNYDAVVTWFPQGEGFFLRGGGGLSTISFEDSTLYANPRNFGGVNLLAGVGYAFWLGQSFNLTLNLDLSAQRYSGATGEPDSSRLWALWVGFDWY